MPGQAQRKQSIRRKLNPIPQAFAGKNVLLVDDSIVAWDDDPGDYCDDAGAGREEGVCVLGGAAGAIPECVWDRQCRRGRS